MINITTTIVILLVPKILHDLQHRGNLSFNVASSWDLAEFWAFAPALAVDTAIV